MSPRLDRAASPRLNRRWKMTLDDCVQSLAWSPSGSVLAAASISGPITLFDGSTGQVAQALAGHGFGTSSVSWRHDGRLLASAGQDGAVRLWEVPQGTAYADFPGGAAWVEQVLWHPRNDLLACSAGKKVRLFDSSGTLLREYPAHASTVADLAWRPGQDQLTSAAYGAVSLWAIDRDDPIQRLEWRGSILKLAWSPDGKHLAHGNQDATVHFWDVETAQELQMAGYPAKVTQLGWDETGTYLATTGSEAVTVWDCTPPGPEGSTPLSLEGHQGLVTALAYQARGPYLVSGGQDGKVYLWQPGKAKRWLAQSENGSPITQLVWSPDQRLLAAGTEAGLVTVYAAG